VTTHDVRRVANKYFTRENRTVAIYTRKKDPSGSAKPELAELAGLSAEQQSAIRAMAGRLKEEKDVEKLKAALGKMEQVDTGADDRTRSFLEIQKKLVQQRIEELK
jgi:hypothetical protein